MTLKGTSQHKSSLKRKILEDLEELKRLTGWKQRAIADRLGYVKDPFANINSGVETAGSTYLQASLGLLLRLERLLRNPLLETEWPSDEARAVVERRAEAAKLPLVSFLIECAVRCGEQVSEQLIVGAPNSTQKEAAQKIVRVVSDAARRGPHKR